MQRDWPLGLRVIHLARRQTRLWSASVQYAILVSGADGNL